MTNIKSKIKKAALIGGISALSLLPIKASAATDEQTSEPIKTESFCGLIVKTVIYGVAITSNLVVAILCMTQTVDAKKEKRQLINLFGKEKYDDIEIINIEEVKIDDYMLAKEIHVIIRDKKGNLKHGGVLTSKFFEQISKEANKEPERTIIDSKNYSR
ncbi:MAG: hypothetical protein LBF28_02300 [Rickettsiales bacterium]|jgi:hypothetical protein|nr:hypothetical protein [Rickettsiales bacterium]